jgi:hypothetical protein
MPEDQTTTSAETKGQMLPGIAGICLFMLMVAIIGTVGVLNGQFQGPGARYAVLPMCTMIAVGVFGLLRMTRWGWALVMAGTLMLSLGYIYMSRAAHEGRLLVMSGLTLCFFLYLVRPEVRDRLK